MTSTAASLTQEAIEGGLSPEAAARLVARLLSHQESTPADAVTRVVYCTLCRVRQQADLDVEWVEARSSQGSFSCCECGGLSIIPVRLRKGEQA